jgi:hypothetical protein
MNHKERIYNMLWLQIFLDEEHEEEDEESSNDKEDKNILQTALIR